MDCALWLNRKKISAAADISDNLDIASLRGYFLAGSLIPWLEEHGGKHYAKRLSALTHDDPRLNDKIARIFGGKELDSAPYKILDGSSTNAYDSLTETSSMIAALTSFNIGSAGSYNYSMITSFGSFYIFLKSFSAAGYGSFKNWEYLTSFMSSSGSKFSEWEWLWKLLGRSSFEITSGGSFTYGWEWLWQLLFGRWNGSSFEMTSGGSFTYGWEWLWQLLFGNSGSFGSFDRSMFGFGSFGSFDLRCIFDKPQNAEMGWLLPQLDEYDLVLLKTLIDCPLDRFGYGIHNI